MSRFYRAWRESCDEVIGEAVMQRITQDQAYTILIAMGMDPHEARRDLDHALSEEGLPGLPDQPPPEGTLS